MSDFNQKGQFPDPVRSAGSGRSAMMKQTRTTSMLDKSYQPVNTLVRPSGAQQQANRMSMPFSASASQSMAMPAFSGGPMGNTNRRTATATSTNNRLLEQPTIPTQFDVKTVRELDSDACMLCEAPFTRKIKVMNRNSQKNCKRCGKAICEVCSENRRQLSKNDSTLYRVCDKCDTLMDNFRLKQNHEDVLRAQKTKIEMLNNQIVQLEEDKQKLQEDTEAEMKELASKLKQRYTKRDELNDRKNGLKQDITHMNNARNCLHESICNLEKSIADLEVEQRRLMSKQATVKTQTIEQEHDLKHKIMINEQQQARLDALKQKVSKQ